jgi:hypothetical protein
VSRVAVAARRCLERVLEARGIDPFAHVDDDAVDDDERARRHASIVRGLEEMKRGEAVPAADVLGQLRRGR